MVKIRLQRQGAKKAPFYHIVVADSIVLDKEKVEQWIKNGAKPTDSVKALIEKAK